MIRPIILLRVDSRLHDLNSLQKNDHFGSTRKLSERDWYLATNRHIAENYHKETGT